MLCSQMQINAPQTKRIETKNSNRKHVVHQTKAYYIITSQPLGVL